MKMKLEQTTERKEGLSQDGTELDPKIMREFIIEVAEQLEDKKLLKMLYIRAKTLKSL